MISINHDISSNCGYIVPDGKFYACKYGEHYDILPILGEIERNLVKITLFDQKPLILIPIENITDQQVETLKKWCELHEHHFPDDEVNLSKEAGSL